MFSIRTRAFVCFLVLLLLSGCAAPWTIFTTDEILPAAVDATTWLPIVESVTVTRLSDGASVVVSGTDVETLYACFDNIPCTRRSGGVTPLYTLDYTMVGRAIPDVTVTLGEYRGTLCFALGEYRYRPVSVKIDLAYLEAILGETAA